jgi:biotin transport system substrate-specific component
VAWPSPTAGFLLGFLPAAFVTGWIVRGLRRRSALTFAGAFGAAVFGGLVVLYPIGWGYVAWKTGMDFSTTLIAAAPFAVFDLIKSVFVALVATAIHRAYPWILPAKHQASSDANAEGASASTPAEESDALTTA